MNKIECYVDDSVQSPQNVAQLYLAELRDQIAYISNRIHFY